MFDSKDNYSMISFELTHLTNATGNRIRKEKSIWPIERYWQTMEALSQYNVTYQVQKGVPLLRTIDGSQIVPSFGRSNGCIVFVPDFIYPENAVEEDGDDEKWTEEAHAFASRLEAALFAIDADVGDAANVLDAPEWVTADHHRLLAEPEIEENIRQISDQVSTLQQSHQRLAEELQSYTSIKIATVPERTRPRRRSDSGAKRARLRSSVIQ